MIRTPSVVSPILLACFFSIPSHSLVEFPGTPLPGLAQATLSADSIVFENDVIRAAWSMQADKLVPGSLTDKAGSSTITFNNSEIFEFEVGTAVYLGSKFRIQQRPTVALTIHSQSATDNKIANRFSGKSVTLLLQSEDGLFSVQWIATLLDGSNYIRQSLKITNQSSTPKRIKKYTYLHQNGLAPVYQAVSNGLQSGQGGSGRGYGSTIGDGNFFFGLEAVYSSNLIQSLGARKEISFFFPSNAAVNPDSSNTKGLVIGVAPKGQMRRAFLYYMSRERGYQYRMVPHYVSWYDLTFSYREDSLLHRIQTFGRELGQKRGFNLKAYQADDGWDDVNKAPVWQNFNSGNLPRGFSTLKDSAAKAQAGMALWFSPMGGYGGRSERIKTNPTAETKTSSWTPTDTYLSMAGPNYRQFCIKAFTDKIRNHGLRVLKFDGLLMHQPDTNFYEALDGCERFNDEIRALSPDIYFNAMGGAMPSPFYLLHFDSYWRDGYDAGNVNAPWAGTNARETWISYRDGYAYNAVTQRSSIVPLSSISLHGITIGHSLYPEKWPRDLKSIKHEVRSFFGTGTGVQELYLSPDQMNDSIYDAIAEAGKWAKANEGVMEDSHWIGGNVWNGEVYGYASWNKHGGTISLRNPKITAQSMTVDIGTLLELPTSLNAVGKIYSLKSPWKEDEGKPEIILTVGKPHAFNLEALGQLQFTVTALDATGLPKRLASADSRTKVLLHQQNGYLWASFVTAQITTIRLTIHSMDGRLLFSESRKVQSGQHRLSWSRKAMGLSQNASGACSAELHIDENLAGKSTFNFK